MQRLLIASLLTALACAANAQDDATVTIADETGTVAVQAQAADAEDADRDDRRCLRSTGSRVVATTNARADRAGDERRACASAHGRSYSREDLERTGGTDLADALRRIDTSIR